MEYIREMYDRRERNCPRLLPSFNDFSETSRMRSCRRFVATGEYRRPGRKKRNAIAGSSLRQKGMTDPRSIVNGRRCPRNDVCGASGTADGERGRINDDKAVYCWGDKRVNSVARNATFIGYRMR